MTPPGRELGSIPGEHTRYFSAHPDALRTVVVRIGSFTGHGMHFHVTMREEPDRVWAPDMERWEVALDDPAGEGRERMMKFRTHKAAERWIESTFATEFDDGRHELVREPVPPRWNYGEGG